tara:strand:- start:1983 stop:2357 length:375 start_codon:yes stop_codon:yes gene_type:complete
MDSKRLARMKKYCKSLNNNIAFKETEAYDEYLRCCPDVFHPELFTFFYDMRCLLENNGLKSCLGDCVDIKRRSLIENFVLYAEDLSFLNGNCDIKVTNDGCGTYSSDSDDEHMRNADRLGRSLY